MHVITPSHIAQFLPLHLPYTLLIPSPSSQLLQEGTVPVITPSHIAQFLPDFPVITQPTWIRSASSCEGAPTDEEQYFSGVAVTGALRERVISHTQHELTFAPSHRTSLFLSSLISKHIHSLTSSLTPSQCPLTKRTPFPFHIICVFLLFLQERSKMNCKLCCPTLP